MCNCLSNYLNHEDSIEEQNEAKKLLSLKANKKMIKDRLSKMSGKVVILKDLSNIATFMKSGKTRNDLEAAVRQLTVDDIFTSLY